MEQCLVEAKPAKKIGPNRPKLGPKSGFCHFFKLNLVHQFFLEIAKDDILKHCLITSMGKTHEKSFMGPKFGPKLGFLPFSQGFSIISFR